MILRLLTAVSAMFLIFGGCGDKRTQPAPKETDATPVGPAGAVVVCPVCGLKFQTAEAAGTVDHNGTKYYFYLKDHLETFRADPETYRSSPPLPSPAGPDAER